LNKSEAAAQKPVPNLPLYQCHKIVGAVKIGQIDHKPNPDLTGRSAASSYGAVITPEIYPLIPFEVSPTYILRHKPEVGGYYIRYEDGYESFSPAKAFEDGYSLIDQSVDQLPWFRDNKRTQSCLLLVSETEAPLEVIEAWTDLQCQQAEEWAIALHLNASDNDDVVVPTRPDFIP
jgi:hypothetical protein